VNYAKKLNKTARKNLSFVLCTNLTLVDNDILEFLKKHDILISTSLDGPKHIHDANRIMRNGQSSYDMFIKKLELTRSVLEQDKISALMTITRTNIYELNRVIDEYARLDFKGIFLRSLNPYGYAKKETGKALQYGVEEFVSSYQNAIRHILELNKQGKTFVEYFAAIILSRILTPFSTGFMDLQSPAGAGILGAIYNFNGDVYPTDEARMLAASGDTHFRLGNVIYNTHKEIFGNELLKKIIRNSCVEIIPGCHSCAYQPYCGADPIRAYSMQNDKTYMGHMPSSEFCKKHREIIAFFLNLIESDDEALDIFWSWITSRDLKQVKLQ
jgi:His-Xaa-Ser system radical SAM maturase HxsB